MRVTNVEELKAAFKSDSRIVVAAGIYRITEPICLEGLHDIVIEGEGEVIFCGSICPQLVWKPHTDQIWVARCEKGLQADGLLLGGKMQTMARYPNRREGEILDGYTRLDTDRVSRWKDPAGGYVRGLHRHEWGGNSFFIRGKDEKGDLILQWAGDNNRGDGLSKDKVVFENIFEELDAPEEWFYDPKEGMLFVYGEPKGQAEIIVNHCLFAFKNCKNIRLAGIAFRDTARSMFREPYERPLRGDWGIQRTGSLFAEGCEGIEIAHCTHRNIGGNAVMLSGKNRTISMMYNDFSEIGASGVLIVGHPSACRDASDWQTHKTVITDTAAGPKSDNYARDITVAYCYFYKLGLFEKQCAAVSISIASRVVVDHCTVHHVPRAGINISDGTFGGHRITHNELFDCVRETSDHGPINAWGRDRFWSLGGYNTTGKRGRSKRKYALLDAIEPTLIEANRLYATRGFGIDLDDGASNYQIKDNICIGAGIKLREGFDRTVCHNLLIASQFDLHCSYAENHDRITDNLIIGHKPFNRVLINRGSDTIIDGNFYDRAAKPKFDKHAACVGPLAVDPFTLGFLKEIEALFPAIPNDFGCGRGALPKIALSFDKSERQTLQWRGLKLSDIDESLRSAAGLARERGAYVEGFGLFCRLKKVLQKGDVLLSVNGETIDDTGSLKKHTEEITTLRIMRDQLEQEIKI